eukprot:5764585-Ditylum_brightwellii.AAC.1
MTKISTTVISNEESLKKIKSKLNSMTQNISKLKPRLNTQKEIYSTECKDINRCILDIASHDQNNKVIYSLFEEKLDKAILNTKQAVTDLSEACNKATSLKFQISNSRFDNINKTLHDHDNEIQNVMNKVSIYSQQKGHFAGTYPTVPNYNNTT